MVTVQVIRSPRTGVMVAGTAKAVVAPLRALVHDIVAVYWDRTVEPEAASAKV